MSNRLPTDDDAVNIHQLVGELLRKISTDVSMTNAMSPEPVTFFRQIGEVHISDVHFSIEITARYPGWEDYIKRLAELSFTSETEDEEDA